MLWSATIVFCAVSVVVFCGVFALAQATHLRWLLTTLITRRMVVTEREKWRLGRWRLGFVMAWVQVLVVENCGLTTLRDLKLPAGLRGLRELRLSGNRLTNLEGLHVCRALTHLDVSHNRLTSLHGCPESVTHLRASNNPLKSLHECPPRLLSLGCSYTHITNFLGCPTTLKSMVACFTMLSGWDGVPPVMDKLYASYNGLRSCRGAPAAHHLDISCNLLTSLDGLPKWGIHELCVSNNKLESLYLSPDSSIRRLRCCDALRDANSLLRLPALLDLFQCLKTPIRAAQVHRISHVRELITDDGLHPI